MARPRAFDEAAVLDAAVQCFWTRGYAATSVRELAEGMGINGPSLYNAFGDKRALYRRALEHYLDQSVRDRIARLEGVLRPREAIAAFLQEIIDRSMSDRKHRGCMLVNAALEVAPHDAEFRRVIAKELKQIEGFFLRCIQAGQQSGEIAPAQNGEDLARLLLGVLLGTRVLARTRPERALLEAIVRPALALLGMPGKPRRKRSVH
ncbi:MULTISPECIES: TetR/AcrR family transcriptional regulator [unclassified Variovorax]|uniref:TetR/AcrR family transcriptional regulator n=1 Tax=unclassified Variovorax TaxID=663243 RepID=UPI003ECD61B7